MARGSQAKAEITQKLLAAFQGAFTYNDGKEIRIPWTEAGESLQIKLSLTCAKTNVEPEGEFLAVAPEVSKEAEIAMPKPVDLQPSPEEKKNVEALLRKLDLI